MIHTIFNKFFYINKTVVWNFSYKNSLFLQVTNKQGKLYTFFLSSEYERSEWLKSLQEVQKALPPNPLMLHAQAKAMSMAGLQGYLTKYRQHLQVRIYSILYFIYKRE